MHSTCTVHTRYTHYICAQYILLLYIMPPCDGAVTDLHDLHARGLNLNNIAICITLKTGLSDTQ